MASVEGLQRRIKEWTPRIQSAFVVYLEVGPSPVPPENIDTDFTMVEVSDPNDPLLPKICSTPRQLRIARKALADGLWRVLVALDPEGEPAGRIWETYRTQKMLTSGVPRMRLAEKEFFMFDLFVERKYRRSGIAHTMADYFFKKYDWTDPNSDQRRFGYGFISYENSASILWHHSIGFRVSQTMNYLEIGPYIKWKLPFSEMPRFGPMSRQGRHNHPDKEPYGPPLFG